MYALEKQMLEKFLKEKNYLSSSANVIINDINKKIIKIIHDFDFLKNIPYSYFKTHFNLTIPSLSIDDIYENIDKNTDIQNISNLKLNEKNIAEVI